MQRFHEGFLVGQRYRLDTRVASGGMGDVWKATDTVLARVVAVKVMRPDAAAEPVFAQRFRDEAILTAGLSHHNVATLLDYGTQDSIAYLVMEFVEGKPLSEILGTQGALAPDRVRAIVAQVALALQAAHESGVIHRDVKPGNILITDEGIAKLTDFGIARAENAAGLTRAGETLGTPNYLSPEQALGEAVTPASDLYSLGVVAHEMLTGSRPFERATPIATALAHVNDPLPTLPMSVPGDLARIIGACLSKDPGDRPASARDVAVELGVAGTELPAPDQPGPSQALGRPARFLDVMLPAASTVALAGGSLASAVAEQLTAARHTAVLLSREDAVESDEEPTERLSLSAAETTSPGRFAAVLLEGSFLLAAASHDRSEDLRRIGSLLGGGGRLVVSFTAMPDYPYATFRDDFLAAGLVPDLILSGWDLRPSKPDSTEIIAVLSRR